MDRPAGIFFDLSDRAKLRVAGGDRIRFLNGQLTNNVVKASESKAIAAAVLDTKGRMNGYLFVHAEADSFWIDAETELRERLIQRLERYIIADDVELHDGTEQFSLIHVISAIVLDPPAGARVVRAERFGQPGFDVWVERSVVAETIAQLSNQFAFCDAECRELFRIERGIPRWGFELNDQINPLEANLEESCIDYEKGCYVGQEVISRMKMSGQKNKKLCGIVSLGGTPFTPGQRLFTDAPEAKEKGWITSTVFSKRLHRHVALAFIKRPFPGAGMRLRAMDSDNKAFDAEIVDLPMVRD